ncbi:hypothetical protein [Sulfitobacter sp. SK012]|uniref:hypothetical protein n=1 Tax=Sulfitobacter sp. SK012 TaxID=1389005 RepID=UPI0013B3C61A|nr:hypothetical protein [Sulfitobacter sp. SK012]
MRDKIELLKDLTSDRCKLRPDRSELADALNFGGATDGFSMEWIIDRYEQHNRSEREQG